MQAATAPNNAATGYTVDDLGNVLTETSPDRGALTSVYDAAGNVKSVTDARGITVTYGYDALNRLTSATFPDVTENVTYSYDTCANGKGRLCTVTDAAGSVTYAYDGFGALAEETRTELGVSYTTRYGYDPLNRVASITYPDGRVVAYTRNSLGQVTDVTLTQAGSTQPLASNLQYRADGLLSGLTYGNGLSESRFYTLAGRLETWTVGSETRGFLYDANGNLKDQTGAVVAGFSYDALDRLQSESLQSFSQTFGYDANGNRQSDGTGSYDYLDASNRLTVVGATSITLDAAGNTLADQLGRTFAYYGAGPLRQAVAKVAAGRKTVTNTTTYAYDYRNLRTRKTVNGVTTVLHYDQTGRLLAETSATGAVQKAYVWLEDRPLAQLAVVTTTSKGKTMTNTVVSYLHTDHLDTPRLATNAQGTVVWRWEGEAFGDTAASEDPDGDGSAATVNLRFPGQYYDAETGLHSNWNRYYDPRSGRYITSDPIGLKGGFNTYAYAYDNPLQWTDPDGLDVRVVTSDRAAAKILMEAYAKLTRTKKGQEICRTLEQSSDVYEIRPIDRDAFYCPPGATDPVCRGKTRAVFIDPYNNVKLPTTSGMQPAPKPVTLGHELGHAIGYSDDGPDMMNNVNANENPIRQQLGLPPRTSYTVPEIEWVPGTK